jgi:phage-related protein
VETEAWKLEFYRDHRGREPVAEFVESLIPALQAKVLQDLDLLEQFGTELSMPLARPVSGYQFWELRSQASGNIARIFYVAAPGRRIVLLHGFVKKTQRTSSRELQIAAARREEISGRPR